MSGLPYGGQDCIAAFLADAKSAPEWSCEHLERNPGMVGFREMCQPDLVRCIACASTDASEPCASSCHCCGAFRGLRQGRFGKVGNVVIIGSLCALCVSFAPSQTVTVMA